MRKKIKISKISALHYFKLFARTALFIVALVAYVTNRLENSDKPFGEIGEEPIILAVIGIVYVVEMIFRFFPSSFESMGCQKVFGKNFIPTEVKTPTFMRRHSTFIAAVAWIIPNAAIGAAYYIGWIDEGILALICLVYSICDMICILFFCPFQTWILKNKCCGTCRIYNWDYAMMFTPLVFIPAWHTYVIFGIALLLLVYWEVVFRIHPERFCEATNAALSCANCEEKLCHHKRQLRHFIKTNKDLIVVKGNEVIEKVIKKKK